MKLAKKYFYQYFPKRKYYLAICIFILLFSFIDKTAPVYHKMDYVTYEYGLINSWAVVYNRQSLNIQGLFYMLTNSNMGVEWIPQNIFIDSALICILFIIIKAMYKKFYKVKLIS